MSAHKAIAIAQKLIDAHPYFKNGIIETIENITSFQLGDCVIYNLKWVIKLIVKNSDGVSYEHKICIGEEEPDKESSGLFYHIGIFQHLHGNRGWGHKFDKVFSESDFENATVYLFYATLDSRVLSVLNDSGFYDESVSICVPKEWQKSILKTLDRFCPESIVFGERVLRKQTHYKQFGVLHKGAEFYPIDSVVEYSDFIFKGEVVVRSIVPSGFQNYLIKSGELYQQLACSPGSSVNTQHVTRVVKRGKDRHIFPSNLIHMYHKLQLREDREITIVDARREIEKQLFENVVATKNIWTVNKNVSDFITSYIQCFYAGKLPDGFIHRFQVWRFYAVVCAELFPFGNESQRKWRFKINKRKMKKEMKRLHCYLDTVVAINQKKDNFLKNELDMYDQLFKK